MLPLPADEYDNVSGLDFASSISSFTDLGANNGCDTSISGLAPMGLIAVNDFTGS